MFLVKNENNDELIVKVWFHTANARFLIEEVTTNLYVDELAIQALIFATFNDQSEVARLNPSRDVRKLFIVISTSDGQQAHGEFWVMGNAQPFWPDFFSNVGDESFDYRKEVISDRDTSDFLAHYYDD